MGTTSHSASPELLLPEWDPRRARRAQLETGLRDAIRCGRLAPGTRLPSSRALAAQLGVSRRLVVDAYGQLGAEGYLIARRGSGTVVAPHARASTSTASAPSPAPTAGRPASCSATASPARGSCGKRWPRSPPPCARAADARAPRNSG